MTLLDPMLTPEEIAVDRHRRRARISDLRAANDRLADRGQEISEITLARIRRSRETLAKSRACVAKVRAAIKAVSWTRSTPHEWHYPSDRHVRVES